MVATPASLEAPTLHLDLPDPEQDDLSTLEFHARLEQAWELCDRFDLQTEIWRGRILADSKLLPPYSNDNAGDKPL